MGLNILGAETMGWMKRRKLTFISHCFLTAESDQSAVTVRAALVTTPPMAFDLQIVSRTETLLS